jgi:N2227-like protein
VCNVVSIGDILQPVLIPDVSSVELLHSSPYYAAAEHEDSYSDSKDDTETMKCSGAGTSTDKSIVSDAGLRGHLPPLPPSVTSEAAASAVPASSVPAVPAAVGRIVFPKFSFCAGDFVELYGPRKREKRSYSEVRSNDNSGNSSSGSGSGSGSISGNHHNSSNSIPNDSDTGDTDVDLSAGGLWDAVVTCFFIDTAPVVME